MNQGLIGSWTPGIGDESLGGWLTVLLYAATAWIVWRLLGVRQTADFRRSRHEQWFWKVLFVCIVLLAINKQLDLQSAFTELGRIVASRGGWYKDRHQVQLAFIAGLSMMGLTIFAATLYLTWGAPTSTLLALAGAIGLLLFVVVRAASFHHVDEWLKQRMIGVYMNWIFEIGSLLLIFAGAWLRQRRHG